MHKPKKTFVLTGRTFRKNKDNPKETLTNAELMERVKRNVQFNFNFYPILIPDHSTLVSDNSVYPEFFAAALYTSDIPISGENGSFSALVVLEHGETMAEANEALDNTINRISWESRAETINWH